MAAFTSIIAAASLAAGVGASAIQYKQRKDDRRDTAARIEQQKIEAREAAKLKGVATEAGAKVKVGTDDKEFDDIDSNVKGTAARKTKTGVGGFSVSASKIGGLS